MAKNLAIIYRELFYFSFALLVVFIGLEIMWPNIILAYFNLNYLGLITLFSGIISLIKK
ncbi:MAG: hypothetical protein WCN88_04175 [Candidatus Falkowbacteria bacterium]